MPYQANRHGGKVEAARKHYANVIESRRTARKEKTKGSLDKYRGMITARRKYGDVLRKQAQFDKNRQMAVDERERKKADSVWSNIAMLGTSVGAMFGPVGAAIGGLAGAGLGMGMAAAKGGDPFDFGAQLSGLDPSMAAKAAMSVGKSMGYDGTPYGDTSKAESMQSKVLAWERMGGARSGYASPYETGGGYVPGSAPGSNVAGGAYASQAAALGNQRRPPSSTYTAALPSGFVPQKGKVR